ncbi:MAG: peptidoglycan DD-metalloendopeptidase family protein [Firmicutes bacterium]|nr:peptidoglycan DD-metalloendopeptidase family protein [Bacillota bacterium]
MFPNKSGSIRGIYFPFGILISFCCLLSVNLYFLCRYPLRVVDIVNREQTIHQAKQLIKEQEKKLQRIDSAIQATHKLEEKINQHNRLLLDYEVKYEQVKKNISTQKTLSRAGSFRPFQLPAYTLTSADTELAKLNVLNGNLEFLEEELRSSEQKLKELHARYTAYNLELDYTPTIYPLVVKGYITSYFGYRRDPVTGRQGSFHEGIDIAARTGTPIRATAAGTVTIARNVGTYGLLVEIKHGNYGYSTRYAHNSKILVKEGQTVKKGDLIAYVGSTGKSTGPHLHYEVRFKNQPVNPRTYLP